MKERRLCWLLITLCCLSLFVKADAAPNDFDGDGRSDIGCYDPSGWWYVYKSGTQKLWTKQYAGGLGTIPVTGDFDGDGFCDYGTYYPASGQWSITQSTAGEWKIKFGFDGTIPVTGDFDGDHHIDFGCYYDQTGWWNIYKSTTGLWTVQFGYSGTLPITGDFDGDGIGDFGCYYPDSGWWYIFKSSINDIWTKQFGYAGTVPVVGDFDGDGIDDVGCYSDEGGNWNLLLSRDGILTMKFGYVGTVPIAGDYDGDGITDFGCYYAPGGNWNVFMSKTKKIESNSFGYEGTIPLQSGVPAASPWPVALEELEGAWQLTIQATPPLELTCTLTDYVKMKSGSWALSGTDSRGNQAYGFYSRETAVWSIIAIDNDYYWIFDMNLENDTIVPVSSFYLTDTSGQVLSIAYNLTGHKL